MFIFVKKKKKKERESQKLVLSKGIKKRFWKSINEGKKNSCHMLKSVPIKTIIQAIPTYNMNIFMTRKALFWEINSLILRFW